MSIDNIANQAPLQPGAGDSDAAVFVASFDNRSIDAWSATLKYALLNRLLFWRGPTVEPVCDICKEPIRRSQFDVSAATLDRSEAWPPSWRITHNRCEPNVQNDSGLSCFEYWIALDCIGTPEGALRMSVHLLGHIGFPRWTGDVIKRLYPTTQRRARAA